MLEMDLAKETSPLEETNSAERERLLGLGGEVREVWGDKLADVRLKKRIAREMIKEVIVESVKDPEWIQVVIHWAGGQHSAERVSKFQRHVRRGEAGKDTIELVRGLAEVTSDKEIARVLNRLGLKTGRGHAWTSSRVTWLRHYHEIAVYDPQRQREKGLINMAQAAERLGISTMSVLRLIREKILPSRQVVALSCTGPATPRTARAASTVAEFARLPCYGCERP